MKRLRFNSRARKAFQGSSRGFTLIEVVIAMALLGIIAVAILSALSTASIALIIADERATAESLARSQMEYIQNSPYIDYSKELSDPEREPDFYGQITIPGGVGDYTLESKAEPIDPSNHQPYPEKTGSPGVYQHDDGIQEITVTITYYTVRGDNRMAEQKYTLVDYKRDPEV
jgi:prepilin-type N-terminal cleavage/methylation domain-containing protein